MMMKWYSCNPTNQPCCCCCGGGWPNREEYAVSSLLPGSISLDSPFNPCTMYSRSPYNLHCPKAMIA